MNVQNLKPPEKGFTKAERAWIRDVVIPALKTNQAIAGRNCTISNEDGKGQTINADDCTPC